MLSDLSFSLLFSDRFAAVDNALRAANYTLFLGVEFFVKQLSSICRVVSGAVSCHIVN